MKKYCFKINIIIALSLILVSMNFVSADIQNNENYELIIISPDDFSQELQRLVDHKNQIGISSNIVTLNDIYNGRFFEPVGRDDPEKIKYFIKNSVEQWNAQYVLLVGNKTLMPVRYAVTYFSDQPNLIQRYFFTNDILKKIKQSSSWSYITDLYYADIYDSEQEFCSWDSNDNMIFGEMNSTALLDYMDFRPDVKIGRLLCKNNQELNVVVDKIINYENNAFNSDWFKNMVLCGGDTHPTFLEFIIPLLFNIKGKIAFEGEYSCEVVDDLLDDFSSKKFYTTSIIRSDAKKLTIDNIIDEIDNGAGFVFFSGHGKPGTWGTHPPFNRYVWAPRESFFNIECVQRLSNQDKLPVFIFSACSCSDFDKLESPITWEVLKNNNGGGIASFGCTCTAFAFPSTLVTKTYQGFLGIDIMRSYRNGAESLGEMWSQSICHYLDDEDAMNFGNLNITNDFMTVQGGGIWTNYISLQQWELFGDPSLKIGGYDLKK